MTSPRESLFTSTPSALAIACAFTLSLLPAHVALADAKSDWQKIVAFDIGPKGKADTRDEARGLMIQNFDQQEQALRAFIAAYPANEHSVEAGLRLSHLLAVRSELEANPALYTAAHKILDKLEADPATPPGKLPDVAYARITLLMHHTPTPDDRERDTLMAFVRKFQKDYPGDHRSANLLAEMATLYDTDPKAKQALLDEALRYAGDDATRQRINDDSKRLSMLGRPIALKFDSIQGKPVDVADYHGKVVLVYFFANWARPSILGLMGVKHIATQFPPSRFQVIGISLDKTKESLDTTLGKIGLDCPVFFDGKGWESPLVRSLGINALPTVWVIDRNGNLRTLNAVNNTEAIIMQLLQEK